MLRARFNDGDFSVLEFQTSGSKHLAPQQYGTKDRAISGAIQTTNIKISSLLGSLLGRKDRVQERILILMQLRQTNAFGTSRPCLLGELSFFSQANVNSKAEGSQHMIMVAF